MPTHSVKARALILCLVLVLAGAVCTFASGQRETRVADAKALIAKKDFRAALSLLTAVLRDNPELRDEVQPLLDQVMATQERFNQVLEQLLAARDAEDDQLMQQLDAQLQQIDPRQAADLVGRTVAVRIAFLNLMKKAAALLDAGRYSEALQTYLLPLKDSVAAGLDLQKPEFDAAGYGALVTTSVADSVSHLIAAADSALGAANASAGAPLAAGTLLAKPLDDSSLGALEPILATLEGEAAAEGLARSAATSLAEENAALASGKGRPEPYLEYLVWLANGRADKTEGMAEAIARIWEGPARAVLASAVARSSASYNAAVTRFDSGDFTGADQSFADAYTAGVFAVKAGAVAAGSLRTSAEAGWSLSASDTTAARLLASDVLAAQTHAAQSRSFRELLADRTALAAVPAPGQTPSAQLGGARLRLRDLMAAADTAGTDWRGRAEALSQQSAAGLAGSDLQASATALADAFGSLAQSIRLSDAAFATEQNSRTEAGFETTFNEIVAAGKKAQDLANGTVGGTPTANVQRQPSEAIKQYTAAADSLSTLSGSVSSFRDGLKAEQPWVLAAEGFQALARKVDSLAAGIASESGELSRLSDAAQAQRTNGLLKKKEADNLFAAAVKSFDQKSYDDARTSFLAARDTYTDSLTFEYDAASLARATSAVNGYLTKIDDATRAQKLAVVDAKMADGRKQFENGDFLKAFNTLQDALRNWRDLQGDQVNPPLDALLEQVRAALQASGGRDLDPTDSRADTVNGFLVNANNQVALANALAKASTQRVQLLNAALVNVQHALDLVPLYRTARALELKIRKALAPNDAQFNSQADKEIGDLIAAYKDGTIAPDKAYFRLKDYYEVRPTYSGLKTLLDQLEQSLGFRISPISAADAAESNGLYQSAVTLNRTGTPDSLKTAVENLNKAISLNPDNTAAQALRRAILLRVGNPQVATLSPDDLRRFSDAKRALLNNDYATAYPILQDLMTKDGGRNKTYTPLAVAFQQARAALSLP